MAQGVHALHGASPVDSCQSRLTWSNLVSTGQHKMFDPETATGHVSSLFDQGDLGSTPWDLPKCFMVGCGQVSHLLLPVKSHCVSHARHLQLLGRPEWMDHCPLSACVSIQAGRVGSA